jgi:pimeloyl-ACP methyl ester carboxylesterase
MSLPTPSAADFALSSLRTLTQLTPPPIGHRVRLPGRGRIFVRQSGHENTLPVVLLHGWVASGGLNWFQAFEPLRQEFRVVAPDLRGHGRGIRSLRGFRLEDCADDVAMLLDAMGIGRAIFVGYSMGGAIAQLIWQRHPDVVAGMVLAATSAAPIAHWGDEVGILRPFITGAAHTTRIAGWSTAAPRAVAGGLRRAGGIGQDRPGSLQRWARAEFTRHHWPTVLEAGRAITGYDGRDWIRHVNVPTAVLVTERDRAVPSRQQRATAEAIPGATVHTFKDGHLACVRPAFGTAVRDACLDVAERVH